jgi:hypothetical protein
MNLTTLAISIQSACRLIVNHVVAVGKVILLSKFRVKLPLASSETITVLANGPTLNDDLQLIDRTKTAFMCVNFFAETTLYATLQPAYYTLCDPVFFVLDKRHDMHERMTNFYRSLFEKTNWPVQLFVPYNSKRNFLKLMKRLSLRSDHLHYCYYNTANLEGESTFIKWLYGKKLAIPSPTSVAVPALMLAIAMHFKRINLTGVSHNFHQDIFISPENKLMIRLPHFYDKGEDKKHQPFLKPNRQESYTMSEFFMVLHKMFKSYEYVAAFAKEQNATVVNYTKDSFIDQFTKHQAS